MHWLLQNNTHNEVGYNSLIEVLERFKLPYSIRKVIPFIGELHPSAEFETKNVICMGSYSLRHYAKKNDFYPGVFDLEPQDFTAQMKHWGQYMLNADSRVDHFDKTYFDEDEMFIRPIHDSKVFAGGLMVKSDFEEWQNKVCVMGEDYGDALSRHTLVQVCKPKQIFAEYRFWIVDQQIITYSLYKRGSKVVYSSVVDNHVINFVNTILKTKWDKTDITLSVANNGWRPHDAFVLDVCETPDGMKVVEINTLNSSGFYAGNMTDLVMALENKFNKEKK